MLIIMMNNKYLSVYYEKGLFWFRIFGYGLLFKNFNISKPMLFSARNRLHKNALYFKHYKIEVLTRKGI